jgi:K+-sensing histidine kinase KdpD
MRASLTRYGTAVVAMAVAILVALLLAPLTDGNPFPILLAAVMFGTWYGGLGPGLLVTWLGVVAGIYFFLAPTFSLGVATASSAVSLGVFTVVALLISSLNAALRDARVRAEVARTAAEAATRATQQALRVRDEFLASASHELRTPLGHIKGFVSTLRQTDVEWDEATRQDFLGEIEREADRLAKLIGDLLDMSRLESGGLDEIERAPSPPRTLVTGGLDRVRGLLNGRAVIVDAPPDLPSVLVEPSQIERVIANLVENAAKYAPGESAITVAATVVGRELQFRVEDEGPGIPDEDLDRIFERFVRLKHDGDTVPGTGLGLAICRRIVEAHGGWIRAENTTSGVQFLVGIPLMPARAEVQGEPSKNSRCG